MVARRNAGLASSSVVIPAKAGIQLFLAYFFRQPQVGAQSCGRAPQPQGSQVHRSHVQASGLMGAFVMVISSILVADAYGCTVRTMVRSQA